ncbi:MAG: D-glycero-beta-D-manno-heptose-7-phosphate kinase [Alphaproteobacteria bacterium]|nr:D-glycero-beta-D-manno-heptose-7-phosphate kinase [Alphaproteobacteria bacterium]
MNNYNGLLNSFQNVSVMVVGDIMLDSFVYGDVSRISPEGPVPVLKYTGERPMLGGAGNVLANLAALGVKTRIFSVIGQDVAGQQVKEMVESLGSESQGCLIDEQRPTIQKTRYVSAGQQLLRVDREETVPISSQIEDKILVQVRESIEKMDALILSDYCKGVLADQLIKELMKLAKTHRVPVLIDSKRKDLSCYQGVMLMTPNRKELEEITEGLPVQTDEEIEKAAKSLMKVSKIENVLVTRSEDGLSLVPKKAKPVHFKITAREVYDVSGAGDSVMAVMAACLAAGASLEQAAQLANIAGGLVVGKSGTASVSTDELLQATHNDHVNPDMIAPVMEDWDLAKEQIHNWQARGLKVGFTNGCFDIVHYGHVNYLAQARAKCDRLVLALNHDQSVRILKGPTRPVNDQMARATVMAALSSIDLVVFFGAQKEGEDNTPCDIVGYLQPDILMKGGDYTIDQLPEGQVVLSYGGEVEIMPLYDGYSTTNIIQKSNSGT